MTYQQKVGDCSGCRRRRPIAAKGLCNTCYRNSIQVTCWVCGLRRRHEANGVCVNCASRRRYDPQRTVMLADFFGPRVHATLVPRPRPLEQHERAALADLADLVLGKRLWAQKPQPARASPPRKRASRPRGEGRSRVCLDCDQFGARLRLGNRCERCWRKAIAAS